MNLVNVYEKVITFLNSGNFKYILIGGMAAGIIGEPRATGDVDIDIILDKKDISDFLKKAKQTGFNFDEKACIKRAKESGSFQLKIGDFHIDFIIASTDLEREAIKRKKVYKIHSVNSNLPTPEDLILLKVIPGRPKDIIDAENITQRHTGKLDKKYLLGWSQKLSDEAEDMRIYREVERLLKL